MSIHKYINILFLSMIILLIAGCAHSYAPHRWLPDTNQIQTEAYGGWLTIEYEPENNKTIEIRGEYITSDTSNVYIYYDSLHIIPKGKITNAVLEIDDKNTSEYTGWTVLGSASTLSHGFYLIFTFPIWLATGISASSGESFRDRYSESDPNDKYWKQIQKFSRFPQGLPEKINLRDLKRKEIDGE
jgi:hypothetical protein